MHQISTQCVLVELERHQFGKNHLNTTATSFKTHKYHPAWQPGTIDVSTHIHILKLTPSKAGDKQILKHDFRLKMAAKQFGKYY